MMKTLDKLVTLEIAKKLKKMGYCEYCKYGWFKRKRGEEWKLLPFTPQNLIEHKNIILAPTLEATRLWMRDNLTYYFRLSKIVSTNVDLTIYYADLFKTAGDSYVGTFTVGTDDRRDAYLGGILGTFKFIKKMEKSKI